ncbi:unnamed protein product, partial [marine sediment metagenome]
IGLLSLYSSSLGQGDFLNFKKQIIFFGGGFFSRQKLEEQGPGTKLARFRLIQ